MALLVKVIEEGEDLEAEEVRGEVMSEVKAFSRKDSREFRIRSAAAEETS